LKILEKKMKQIIKQNQKFEQYELPFEEARDYLSAK
jgi:threonyl-tRNA synthetase